MNYMSTICILLLFVAALQAMEPLPEKKDGKGSLLLELPQKDPIVHKWPKSMAYLGKAIKKGRNFISPSSGISRWPGGRIPVQVTGTITAAEREKVSEAARHLGEHTCLRFVPRVGLNEVREDIGATFDRDYVFLQSIRDEANRQRCTTQIGKRFGRSLMHLGEDCFTLGTLVHNFLHAAGMIHEFVDPDRDSAVKVNWENLRDADAPDFWKYVFAGVPLLSTCVATGRDGTDYSDCFAPRGVAERDPFPYDFKSIMHFEATAQSRNGQPVLVAKDPEVVGMGGERLSLIDIYKINHIYGCPQQNAGCPSGGLTTGETSGFIIGDEEAGSECRWDISVKPGQKIRVYFNSFEFNGSCLENSLSLRQKTDGPIQDFCATNQPSSVLITEEHELSIKLKRSSGNSSKFRIFWEVVKAADPNNCCNTVALETSNSDSGVGLSLSRFLGGYTASATEITTAFGVNYPVYVKESDSNLILDRIARENGQNDFGTPWLFGSRSEKTPGEAAGNILLGPSGLTCPTTDNVFIRAGRDLDARVKCLADCGMRIPAPPAQSVPEQPSDTSFGAVAVYTCVADSSIRLFATCQQDSTWSSVAGGDCPANIGTIPATDTARRTSSTSTTTSPTMTPMSTSSTTNISPISSSASTTNTTASSTKSSTTSTATTTVSTTLAATTPFVANPTATTATILPTTSPDAKSSSTISSPVNSTTSNSLPTHPGPYMTTELTKDAPCTTITTDGWPFRQAFIFWWFNTNQCDALFTAVEAPVGTDNTAFCNQDYVNILQENDDGVLEDASVNYCGARVPTPVTLPNNNGRRNMLLYDARQGNGIGLRALICATGCRD